MRRALCWLMVSSTLIIISPLSATTSSRPLRPTHGLSHQHALPPSGSTVFLLESSANQPSYTSMEQPTTSNREEKDMYGQVKSQKIGSRPPSCDSKCYGCLPCVAIQVPTTYGSRFCLQSENYLPEGWKCRCGHYFYSP